MTLQDMALNMMSDANFLDFENTEIDNVINFARARLFDFPYSFPDDKDEFERQFFYRFYMHEIGFESENLFKLNLKSAMFRNAQKWGILFNKLLKDYDIRNFKDLTTTSDSDATVAQSAQDQSTSTNDNVHRNIFSDVPDDRLDLVDDSNLIEYASTLSDDKTNTTTESNSTSSGNSQSHATATQSVTGTPGNDDNEQYAKFLATYENFYDVVFKDLHNLFMRIY